MVMVFCFALHPRYGPDWYSADPAPETPGYSFKSLNGWKSILAIRPVHRKKDFLGLKKRMIIFKLT